METKILKPTLQNFLICADIIRSGGVVAFPTETVYGLGADATNNLAVSKVFNVKGRPQDNPLIVHLHDKTDIEKYGFIKTECARQIIKTFMPGPITIVVKKRPIICESVTCGLDSVGLRVPVSQIARDFIKACNLPIAAPSANSSGRPSPTNANHVMEDLKGKLEYIIGGESSEIGIESTVVDVTENVPKILRYGAITPQMIIAACGNVLLPSAVEGDKRSPGTRYKHYAPSCKVVLFKRGDVNSAEEAYKKYDLSKVIGFEDTCNILKLRSVKTISAGADALEYASKLYDLMRAEEKTNHALILEISDTSSIGDALNDRILRAAGTIDFSEK